MGHGQYPALTPRRAARRLSGIEREQFLRTRNAFHRVAAETHEALARGACRIGERRRHDDGLLERAAKRLDSRRFVDGRPEHREVEAPRTADVSVQQVAKMQRE